MRLFSLTCAGLAAASLSFLSFAPSARADVAPDPCDTLEEGDACEDLSGDPGICVDEGTYLYCDTETGTGGEGGSNAGGSSSGGSSTGGSSSGGSGTGGSADTGGTSEDDSCTVSTVGASGSAEAAALLALLGACFAFRNKRRVRRF